MNEHVKTDVTHGVMTLTLQRPEKKNALTGAMYNALSDGLERAETDPAVKVVLFQGDGDSFTAGNDLADFSAQSAAGDPGREPRVSFHRQPRKGDEAVDRGCAGQRRSRRHHDAASLRSRLSRREYPSHHALRRSHVG